MGSGLTKHKWGNCVLAPIFNPNCDLTSIFITLHFLPCLKTRARFTPTPSIARNSVKEDKFSLVNIAQLFVELCEYNT